MSWLRLYKLKILLCSFWAVVKYMVFLKCSKTALPFIRLFIQVKSWFWKPDELIFFNGIMIPRLFYILSGKSRNYVLVLHSHFEIALSFEIIAARTSENQILSLDSKKNMVNLYLVWNAVRILREFFVHDAVLIVWT